MPVRMVALRKHYVSEARKEYDAGESYVVHDKRIAEKLERRMKAKSQPETAPDRRFPPAAAAAPAPAPAAPKVRARALTAETETPGPTTPVPTTPVPPAASGPAPATLVELPAPDVGKPALTTAAVPDTGETAESKARYARRDLRAEEA